MTHRPKSLQKKSQSNNQSKDCQRKGKLDVPRRSLWAVISVPTESPSSGQPWMLVGRDVEQSASEVTVAGSSCLRLALALALVSRTWARLLPRPVSEVLPGAAVGTEGTEALDRGSEGLGSGPDSGSWSALDNRLPLSISSLSLPPSLPFCRRACSVCFYSSQGLLGEVVRICG